MTIGPDFDPVQLGFVKHVHVETTPGDDSTILLVTFGDGGALVVRAKLAEQLVLDVRPAPRGLQVRPATHDEQREAILQAAQHDARQGRVSHDCGEWRHGLRCGLCGAWLG